AVIPLGYADGIPRAATGVAPLWLAGRRRTIAGTVSMDQVVVDIGEDDVSVGDEALLFGPGDHGEPTADDWGSALGTIGYEIVTRIGPRVPRRYLGES
ncbi:MAG: alanine racemase, partial [Frankiaceae bacterium]|nr:alanine racemase [Frankiaceae bacterium]